jgi:citrate/tricarballylate utilization protein
MPATNMHTTAAHASAVLKEADRLMVVCNSCRYCEGLCAVFPAMEMRRVFHDGDLNYLANLCHNCGACYFDCQFSPPHEFEVDVPRAFARVRAESYQVYAWPKAFAGVFARNGLIISVIAVLSVAAFVVGFVASIDPPILLGIHTEAGAFYRLMRHNAMVILFGAVFLYSIVAIVTGARMFWRDIGGSTTTLAEPSSLWQATRDACRLRYLDGGEGGCMNHDDRPNDTRKHYHHATFYGFMLCFAATVTATLYHYLLGREAPYSWYDLPVMLGTIGGIGLIVGPLGLLAAKLRRDPALRDDDLFGMDAAFLALLFMTSVTGLALLALRSTAAMGLLLALHLGVVFALFVTLPYGKFVHGIYRFLALVRYAKEQRSMTSNGQPRGNGDG